VYRVEDGVASASSLEAVCTPMEVGDDWDEAIKVSVTWEDDGGGFRVPKLSKVGRETLADVAFDEVGAVDVVPSSLLPNDGPLGLQSHFLEVYKQKKILH